VPVVPEIVTGPFTWLLLNSTPPRLLDRSTPPDSVFPAHGPVAASPPISTSPVLPVTESPPDSELPQTRTTVAPEAWIAPETFAPARPIAPPGSTVIAPLILAPGPVQNAWPAATVSAPRVPVRHGAVVVTVSVPATNGPKL